MISVDNLTVEFGGQTLFANINFVINDGERIAQMVIARHERAEWEETVELSETERGAGGFGHTGVK